MHESCWKIPRVKLGKHKAIVQQTEDLSKEYHESLFTNILNYPYSAMALEINIKHTFVSNFNMTFSSTLFLGHLTQR